MSIFPDGLYEYGGVPVGMQELQPRSVRWAYSDISAASYSVISTKGVQADRLHSTVQAALDAATAARNDTVFLTPETHDQTATITWSKANTHLIGMHNGSRWANSCIIENTSASTVTPVFTLSGANCLIKNIHFKHAVGENAANLTAVRISSAGNLFQNCWFEGPCDNSVADLATARTVQLGGGGNTFKNCVFGSTSVFRSAAGSLVEFYTSTYRATFEDCIFYCHVDATTPTMIYIKTNKAVGSQFFRNCQFVVHSTGLAYAMTNLIGSETSDSSGQYCFLGCQAYNVTNISGSGAGWPGLAVYWDQGSATTTSTGRAVVPTT